MKKPSSATELSILLIQLESGKKPGLELNEYGYRTKAWTIKRHGHMTLGVMQKEKPGNSKDETPDTIE